MITLPRMFVLAGYMVPAWLLISAALFSFTRSGPLDSIEELKKELSSGAAIYLQGSTEFVNATTRWQIYKEPNITVVVEVATEKDVSTTVDTRVAWEA
jgi:hypothetical protein